MYDVILIRGSFNSGKSYTTELLKNKNSFSFLDLNIPKTCNKFQNNLYISSNITYGVRYISETLNQKNLELLNSLAPLLKDYAYDKCLAALNDISLFTINVLSSKKPTIILKNAWFEAIQYFDFIGKSQINSIITYDVRRDLLQSIVIGYINKDINLDDISNLCEEIIDETNTLFDMRVDSSISMSSIPLIPKQSCDYVIDFEKLLSQDYGEFSFNYPTKLPTNPYFTIDEVASIKKALELKEFNEYINLSIKDVVDSYNIPIKNLSYKELFMGLV